MRFARVFRPFGAQRLLEGHFPAFRCMDFADFGADVGQGLQEKLGNVGQGQGVAARDAVFGDQAEELAQDMVNVTGGLEVTGERCQASGDFFGGKKLALVARVEQAERRVMGGDGHTAGAAVGEWKLAETIPDGPAGEGKRLGRLGFGGARGGAWGRACVFHTD